MEKWGTLGKVNAAIWAKWHQSGEKSTFYHPTLYFYRQVGSCQSAAYISSALIFNINK